MDDDWATSGALEKDVFISEIHNEKRTIDIMKLFDDDIDGFSDGRDHINIKMEPNDETSDYHGSSSGSPSSSLSSPNEFKDEPLGLDIHFGSALFNGQFSPSATSSHSPTYGMMNGGHSMAPQQHSPLPSVAHFSHNHHLHHHIIQQQQQQPTLQLGMNQVYHSPSPQYNHNPNNLHSFMFKDASIYEGMDREALLTINATLECTSIGGPPSLPGHPNYLFPQFHRYLSSHYPRHVEMTSKFFFFHLVS
ncbi:hypothetical protein CAEBREN_03929 [Caenorhabditis brenneri]|uniref:Uncharacterized protein n=1 Tax=Caenorhabditis brenneri TaxID=135651 RepID=G0PDL7_CAEBE|nr:hypothetical protein CAEBREN_03929 [Caenorhabditis brenneri]